MYRDSKIYPQDFLWEDIFSTASFPMGDSAVEEAVALHKAGFEVKVDSTSKTWFATLEDRSELKPIIELVLNYLEVDDKDVFCMSTAKVDGEVYEMTVGDLVKDAVNIEGFRQYPEIADYVTNHFSNLSDTTED